MTRCNLFNIVEVKQIVPGSQILRTARKIQPLRQFKNWLMRLEYRLMNC